MQCDDCIMYEADDNYCQYFKMRATDFDFECTLMETFEYEQEEVD